MAGTEVVQLYLSDPVAQVVRPVRWLAGFARLPLFTGLAGSRIVEPGEIGVGVGGASDDLPLTGSFTLTGPVRAVGADRVLETPVSIHNTPS